MTGVPVINTSRICDIFFSYISVFLICSGSISVHQLMQWRLNTKKTVSVLPTILAAFALNACNDLNLMQAAGDNVAGTGHYEVQRHRVSEPVLVDSSDHNFNDGLNSDDKIEAASQLLVNLETDRFDKDRAPERYRVCG